MITIYIRESINDEELLINKRFPKFINKIFINLKKKCNYIKKEKIENDILYVISNIEHKNAAKKLQKMLKNEDKNAYIVLSNRVKKIKNLQIKQKIINGKQFMKCMTLEILDYIINIDNNNNININININNDKTTQFQDIYILQKENNIDIINMIEYLIDKVKTINIVTDNINKYKKIEENLYNQGYIITVSSNKKKSLKRAEIILNMNFTKEELMQFNINRNAVIINYANYKIDNLIGFEGIIVNNIDINLENELIQKFKGMYNQFELVELYESILGQDNFLNQVTKIDFDKIQIKSLIGNNGIISKKELILNKKILTNNKNRINISYTNYY